MKTVILVSGKDDETGTLGLMIKGTQFNQNMFAASEGSLIAHDLIEHQNGSDQIGSIDDELEALGGIWYVRGQHGELQRNGYSNYTPEQNIAYDITRMFRDYFYGQYVNMNFNKGKNPVTDDESLKEIISQAKFQESEFDQDNDDLDGIEIKFKEFLKIALQRMRIGYSKARRKYERKGRFVANNIFWNISDAVQKYCKPEYEGIEFKLSYNKDIARVEEIMEDY